MNLLVVLMKLWWVLRSCTAGGDPPVKNTPVVGPEGGLGWWKKSCGSFRYSRLAALFMTDGPAEATATLTFDLKIQILSLNLKFQVSILRLWGDSNANNTTSSRIVCSTSSTGVRPQSTCTVVASTCDVSTDFSICNRKFHFNVCPWVETTDRKHFSARMMSPAATTKSARLLRFLINQLF